MTWLGGLLSCVLALFGLIDEAGTTRIARSVENGTETLFSKSTLVDGTGTFECYVSRSGECHYRIYAETCARAAADAPGAMDRCRRRTLDAFVLEAGQRRQVHGLPADARLCVAGRQDGACA